MQLPLYIFQVGDSKVNRIEKTRDISSGGVSFFSGDEIGIGDRVDYMITLSGSNPPVRIRCLGKVLRSQKISSLKADGQASDNSVAPFEVAVTMERYSFVKAEELSDFAIPA
jgi:PilZ domain-containing protein